MAEVVGDLLRARGLRVALAESCTGGLLGAQLTAVPGSSDYFAGGVVAYSNAVKEGWLGVASAIMAAHGAVSGEVAEAMAGGARERFGTELGLAVTGIAGPGGGSAEKPVGLVYLGLATPAGQSHRRLQLLGGRELIRDRAALYALDLLRRHLSK
jgi:nicotinamide-nucleotide amidase